MAAAYNLPMTLKLAPNVTVLPVITTLDIKVERVLQAGHEAKLQKAVLIGVDGEGNFFFSSSVSDGGDVLWMMEVTKAKLIGAIE